YGEPVAGRDADDAKSGVRYLAQRREFGEGNDPQPNSDATLRDARRHREGDAVLVERRQRIRHRISLHGRWRQPSEVKDVREALMTTNLALPDRRSGKVRDIYSVTLANGTPGVLIVATDRISAFDVVMANGLPGKGVVLTQISSFWFDHFEGSVN